MAAQALVFQDTNFNIIDRSGQAWLRAAELSKALGYAREDSISRIYDRNADEFTSAMSQTVNLTVKGFGNGESEKPVRIFSLRGAHLLAMFARTEVAKQFRKWVLDVLEKETALPFNPQKDIQDELYRVSGGKRSVIAELSRRLRDRFGVARYPHIPEHQCQAAVEYVRSLRGEYIPKAEPTSNCAVVKITVDDAINHNFKHLRHNGMFFNLNIIFDGYLPQQNPLRRLLTQLKEASRNKQPVFIEDIAGAEMTYKALFEIALDQERTLSNIHRLSFGGHGIDSKATM